MSLPSVAEHGGSGHAQMAPVLFLCSRNSGAPAPTSPGKGRLWGMVTMSGPGCLQSYNRGLWMKAQGHVARWMLWPDALELQEGTGKVVQLPLRAASGESIP